MQLFCYISIRSAKKLFPIFGLNIFYFKRKGIANKHKAYEWLSRYLYVILKKILISQTSYVQIISSQQCSVLYKRKYQDTGITCTCTYAPSLTILYDHWYMHNIYLQKWFLDCDILIYQWSVLKFVFPNDILLWSVLTFISCNGLHISLHKIYCGAYPPGPEYRKVHMENWNYHAILSINEH